MSVTVGEREPETISQRSALMSIKPHYVEAILRGENTIELRRKPPIVVPGSTIFLYSTSPTSQLIGKATLGRMIAARPDEFRREHARFISIDRDALDKYFDGAAVAHGLQVHSATEAPSPLSLTRMREIDMSPPQSWRYVDSAAAALLRQELSLTAHTDAERSTLLNEAFLLVQSVASKALREVARHR